jgi:hypothetical protein
VSKTVFLGTYSAPILVIFTHIVWRQPFAQKMRQLQTLVKWQNLGNLQIDLLKLNYLNVLDYCFWVFAQEEIYKRKPCTIEEAISIAEDIDK